MKNIATLTCGIMLLTAPALDEEKKPAQEGMDMSKMGPWTRKPTNEKKTKKEIKAFFKAEDALAKKGDFKGALARLDFPIYMFTDAPRACPKAAPSTRPSTPP